jgi:hypothetical protein
MDRFNVLAGNGSQLFAVADEQGQVAKAVDAPRNAVG